MAAFEEGEEGAGCEAYDGGDVIEVVMFDDWFKMLLFGCLRCLC